MSVIINNISFQGRTLLSSSGSTANFSISISGNESNYNLLTALVSAGYNGTDIITVNVTINTGALLTATTEGYAAFSTGILPAGSIVNITNNGAILGHGGHGGDYNGIAGNPGGTAIDTTVPLNISTISGYIFGGGGGGGGGTCDQWSCGGGGGAGGGTGGAGTGYYRSVGQNGTTGLSGVGGYGSPGGDYGYGYGGHGGAYGTAGGYGTDIANHTTGVGGRGGYSVNSNGNTITWINGNDSTHVKGIVF